MLNRIRPFVFLVFLFAFLCVGCKKSPKEVEPEQWRSAMKDLLADYPEIIESITAIEHDAFVDERYVWKIDGQSESVAELIKNQQLEPATIDHPKFAQLLTIVPERWNIPTTNIEIYSTPEYGKTHQEGVWLLLIVRDLDNDITYALYEWIF